MGLLMWQDTSVYIQNAQSKAPNWDKRSKVLAERAMETDASFIAFQELYFRQAATMDKLLAGKYGRGAYRAGRVIYYRINRWRPVGVPIWKNMQAGKSKPAVGRKFERLDNKNKINLINVHLSYEVSKEGQRKRKAETYSIVDWAKLSFKKDRRVFVGDWNSPAGSTNRPDDSGPIMARNGYHDLGVALKTKLGRGNYHIDRAFGSDTNTVPLDIRIDRHRASDHNGVFVKFRYKVK